MPNKLPDPIPTGGGSPGEHHPQPVSCWDCPPAPPRLKFIKTHMKNRALTKISAATWEQGGERRERGRRESKEAQRGGPGGVQVAWRHGGQEAMGHSSLILSWTQNEDSPELTMDVLTEGTGQDPCSSRLPLEGSGEKCHVLHPLPHRGWRSPETCYIPSHVMTGHRKAKAWGGTCSRSGGKMPAAPVILPRVIIMYHAEHKVLRGLGYTILLVQMADFAGPGYEKNTVTQNF